MPRLNMETEHCLGRDEAMRRLQEKFSESRDRFGTHVDNLEEQWNENVYSFGFRTMGMKVSGTITVDDALVKLAADLPMAAMLIKGTIEQRIREELGGLLI